MPGEQWRKEPEEWQSLVVQLLKLRYSVGEFIEVPDNVRGDCGIEGFTRDGKAFQCYAAEELIPTAELTRRQKGKITADMPKMKTNATALQAMLGPTKISRWLLVVPHWEDKSLQAHAESKASELRAAQLSHLTADFCPAILTLEDFQVECGALARSSRSRIMEITGKSIAERDCADWIAQNDEFVQNLDRKALAICMGNQANAYELRNRYIRHYLEGQNALAKLRLQMPDAHEAALKIKGNSEEFLATESLIPTGAPPQKLKDAMEKYANELEAELPGMSRHTILKFVYEAIADWLLRCPLDFPEVNTP